MGAGFIIGGYCPGTSFCGASIGKIDALVFIGGLFIGVGLFGAGYPLWEKLYMAEYLGSPKISESLGMSDGVFGLLLIIMLRQCSGWQNGRRKNFRDKNIRRDILDIKDRNG